MAAVTRVQRAPLKESKTAPAVIPQLQHFVSTKPNDNQPRGARQFFEQQEPLSYPALRPIQTQPQQYQQGQQQQQQRVSQQQQQQAHAYDSPETTLPPVTPPSNVALGIGFLPNASNSNNANFNGVSAPGKGPKDRETPPSQKPPPYSVHPQPQTTAYPMMDRLPANVTGLSNHSPTQAHPQAHGQPQAQQQGNAPQGSGTSPTLRRITQRVPVPNHEQQQQSQALKDVLREVGAELISVAGRPPPGHTGRGEQSSPTTARAPPPPMHSHSAPQIPIRQAQSQVFPSGGSPDLLLQGQMQGQGRGQTPPHVRRIPIQRSAASGPIPQRRDSSGNVPSPTELHFQPGPAVPAGPRARTISTDALGAAIAASSVNANTNSSSSEERTTPTYLTAYTSLPSVASSQSDVHGNTTDYSEPFPFDKERMDSGIQARLVPRSGSGNRPASGVGPRAAGNGGLMQRSSARGTPEQPLDDRDDEGEDVPQPMQHTSTSEGTEFGVLKRYVLSDTPSQPLGPSWEGVEQDGGDRTPPPGDRRPSGNSQSLPRTSDNDPNATGGMDSDYLNMETPRSIPSALPGEGNDFPGGPRYARSSGAAAWSWPSTGSRGQQGQGQGRFESLDAFAFLDGQNGQQGSQGRWNDGSPNATGAGNDPTVRYSSGNGREYNPSMYDFLTPTSEVSSLDGIIMGYQQQQSGGSAGNVGRDSHGNGASNGGRANYGGEALIQGVEEMELRDGRMAQPFPKHPFPFRGLEAQVALRAQMEEMRISGRVPLAASHQQQMAWLHGPHAHIQMEDGDEQEIPPTREGSVSEGFEGNVDAIMNYIGRPPAPIPPTPFTGTAAPTPANDARLHRNYHEDIPPLPAYSNVYPPPLFPHEPGPYTDSTVSSPYMGDPFLRNHPISVPSVPSAQSTPSVRGINLAAEAPLRTRAVGLGSRPGQTHPVYSHVRPPSSVSGESADPQDTESEGEEDDDDVWVDEASDDDLDNEFHQDYITDKGTRRTRFESKMRTLVKQFRDLDRSTDATMLLIASNPDQRHTHLVLSRSVRRHPNYVAFAQSARHSFAQVADSRRAERASRARVIQHPPRPNAMKRRSSAFLMSSQNLMPESARSGSTGSDSTRASMTGAGTTTSMTSPDFIDQLKMLKAIDPNKMSATDFRTAIVSELDKLVSLNGGLKQHAQAQAQLPDSTEELHRRVMSQYHAAGLTGRDGVEILWRGMQADRSLSSTEISGSNGSDLR